MPTRPEPNKCGQAASFSLGEKIFAQTTFNAGVLVGVYGIWLFSPYLALAYLVFVGASFALLVRYTICARCPHLLEDHECLFLPPALAKNIVSLGRDGQLGFWERVIFYGALLGALLIPLWFLPQEPALLVAFLVLLGGCYVALYVRFCKKCRTAACPMNKRRAKGCSPAG